MNYKTALITGATSGIGKAIAFKLASLKIDLIITGRRAQLLNELADNLSNKYNIRVAALNFDVQNREDTIKALNSIPKELSTPDILINNAGLAVNLTPINEGIFHDWDRMIDTNIKGLLNVTRAISERMVKQRRGLIINIGSIAGKQVYPGGNVYCATKHAVDALTKALRIELLKHNIKVSQIAPANVETEFSNIRFKGDKERAEKVYEGYTPLYAKDIAETVEFIVTRPEHVNINDILITSKNQADVNHLFRE